MNRLFTSCLMTVAVSIAPGCRFYAAESTEVTNGGSTNGAGLLSTFSNDRIDDSLMRVKLDRAKRVKDHALVRDRTSDDWRFALDVGDGDFGAAIYGLPNQMRFDIGKNDITIHDREISPSFPAMPFDEIRKRLAAGDTAPVWKAAHDSVDKHSSNRNGDSNSPCESWCGRLTMDFLGGKKPSDYREQLDFWSATATSFFKVDGREESIATFASQPAEVMVIRGSSMADVVRCFLSRNSLVDHKDPKRAEYQPKFMLVDGLACLRMTMPSGDWKTPDEYVVMMGCDGGTLAPVEAATPDKAHQYASWQVVRSGKPLTFFLTVVSNRDVSGPRAAPSLAGRDLMEVAKARIQSAVAKGYDALRQEHLQWWRNYWNRSWVLMNETVGETPWYFSLYKAGSARRPGKVPPGYAAPWRGTDRINWGHLCFNYEIIKASMGGMVSNHGEQLEPLIGTLWHTRKMMAARTKASFGMEGLCYPHAFSNRGNICSYKNTVMNVGTSGEATHLVWEYYEFTQDKEFLRNIGYPMLRDVARFFRQYLQEDANQQFCIFPSYFSEFPSFLRDSITDQAMFRATFERAAKAAETLDVDPDQVLAWRDAIQRMRPLVADTNGAWLASSPDNPTKERLQNWPEGCYLRLYPIFPGDLVNRWHGSEELRKQAETTYRLWLNKHPDVWDKSFSYIDAARMGDRAYYPAMLRHTFLNRTEFGNINGSSEEKTFRRINISVDAGTAFPAGVLAEFLLNSQFDEIRLFPAMPLTGHYAFNSLRARGGFLVSSEFRDGKVPYVLVKSLTGNPCTVIQPFDAGTHVVVRDLGTGKPIAETAEAKAEQPVSFKTVNGHVYVVERKDLPLEQVPTVQR